jgi:16S rRNA (guanine527-N7)-methyltransferase
MPASFAPLAALTPEQRDQLARYEALLAEFNAKINLISRPSEARVRTEHTLHSLALAWRAFPPGARVVDFGTGGGLPAVPLAIRFPQVPFTVVDANGKKVRAVRAMARRLGLENLTAQKSRAEAWPGTASHAVSRATVPLGTLWRWHRRTFAAPSEPAPAATREDAWPPGLLALKGGDLSEEIAALREAFPAAQVQTHALRPLLGDDFFAEKRIVAVQSETARN